MHKVRYAYISLKFTLNTFLCTLQLSTPACQTHVQMAGPVMNWRQGSSASVHQAGMGPPVLKVRVHISVPKQILNLQYT